VLKQITADHTMADHGVVGPAAAQLSRAVGIWPTVPIDIIAAIPEPGDTYLLCSDGLTKMLKDDKIAEVLIAEEDPKTAVERLIFCANASGGKDNITVVLVRVAPTAPGAG
jgi:protein phosphatase